MISQTNEQALESSLEKYLTGTCHEELKEGIGEPTPTYVSNDKFYIGHNRDFIKEYTIDEKRFLLKTSIF